MKPKEKPISHGQKGIWLACQLSLQSTAYNIARAFLIPQEINSDVLKKAFQQLIDRHACLRTTFGLKNGSPIQRIVSSAEVSYQYERIIDVDEYQLHQKIKEAINCTFDLEYGPLMKVYVWVKSSNETVLLIVLHHLIIDLWSMKIFLKDLKRFYAAQQKGELLSLPKLHFDYVDYVNWQIDQLKNIEENEHWKYWKDQLSGELVPIQIPTDKQRPMIQTHQGAHYNRWFSSQLVEKLQGLARKEGVTFYVILLSIFYLLLHRYSNQTDLIVGSSVLGRYHAKFRHIMGYFINQVALRTLYSPFLSCKDFIRRVQETVSDAMRHQTLPFSLLVEKLKIPRDPSRSPIFQIMFNYLGDLGAYTKEKESEELSLEMLPIEQIVAQFDLNLMISNQEGQVRILWEYNTDLFDEQTIRRMADHFELMARAISERSDCCVSEIPLVSAEEMSSYQGAIRSCYSNRITLDQLFQKQAKETPYAQAIIDSKKIFTYNQLERKVDQLANLLRKNGVSSGKIVGVLGERSSDLIVAMLAILKAGGTYLPIDPMYPLDRIFYILRDSQTDLVFSQKKFKSSLTFVSKVFDLDDEKIYQDELDQSCSYSLANAPAYVIYTSGSTGNPKGVVISHCSAVNYIGWAKQKYVNKNACCYFPFYSSIAFDLTMTSIFTPLVTGNCLVIHRDSIQESGFFPVVQQANILKVTPSHLKMILEMETLPLQLNQFIVGGEVLEVDLAKQVQEKFGSRISILNEYGPTEATIGCMIHDFDSKKDCGFGVPIGHPIDNMEIYLLNTQFQLVPIQVIGEVCIAGIQVAQGYLNRPDLTAENFVPNPFKKGARLYRTGDYARRLPNGMIEFLGRKDHQVKIRGHRVELGEITAQIVEHPLIKESVVRISQDKQRIIAYFVSQEKILLREFLIEKIPSYMMPHGFIQIEAMPLTSNGKIDDKRLPQLQAYTVHVECAKPRNDMEKTLLYLWAKVLEIPLDQLGINHNFFDVGGDSIKAVQIISRLHKHFFQLKISDFFHYPTIEQLAKCIIINKVEIDQGLVTGNMPFTPIQFWFLEEFNSSDRSQFNQAVMLYNKFFFKEDLLREVFKKLIEHHDALRIIFSIRDSSMKQINQEIKEGLFELHLLDFRESPNATELIQTEISRVQKSIDIEEGPLVKLRLFRLMEGDHLLIVIHHLIIDGVSWRILLEDLANGYTQASKGEPLSLPEKTHSYKEWAENLFIYAQSPSLQKEREFWENLSLQQFYPLPVDNDSPQEKDDKRCSVVLRIGQSETEQILTKVHRVYHTDINDILLLAWGLAIKEWSGHSHLFIDCEGHGREQIMENMHIDRTLGWFTSIYPVILDLSYSVDIGYQLRMIKESLRRIPNKGIDYGIIKYMSHEKAKNFPIFQMKPEINFNYLGQIDREMNTAVFTRSPLFMADLSTCVTKKHPYMLDIQGELFNACLQFVLTSESQKISHSTLEKIVQYFRIHLASLIDHCLQKETYSWTPSDFHDKKLTLEEFDWMVKEVVHDHHTDIENIYPLSHMQQGMIFHYLLNPQSSVYHEQITLFIKGTLNLEVFQESFQALIDRHEAIRTVILHERIAAPRAVVLRKAKGDFLFKDISLQEDQDVFLADFQKQDREKPFNISSELLMRLAVLKRSEDTYAILWSFHHIIIDGWTLSFLFREFLSIYQTLKSREVLVSSAHTPSYHHYIKWLEKQDYSIAMEYWKRELEGYEKLATLPKKSSSTTDSLYILEKCTFELSKELSDQLSCISKSYGVTLAHVFQSLWGIVLQKYNNTNDVVFGYVTSGRSGAIAGIEEMLGLFINTIPFRFTTAASMTFVEVLQEVKNKFLETERYSYLSLTDVQTQTELKQNLFDHIFIFENYPFVEQIGKIDKQESLGFIIDKIEVFEQTNYNFNITLSYVDQIRIEFIYNSRIYDRETVERIREHLKTIIQKIVQYPDICIADIEICSPEEKYQQLVIWNKATSSSSLEGSLFPSLFEEQVMRAPKAPALFFESRSFTYQELNAVANQWAHYLVSLGVGPETRVGICIDRSPEMIIGLLAILKAGGTYVPLDPSYPQERLKWMINDAKMEILLTQEHHSGKLEKNTVDLIYLDKSQEKVEYASTENLVHFIKPEHLAYVIYTSGSMGVPKGVMISHAGFRHYLSWCQSAYGLTQGKGVPVHSSFSFDATITVLFAPLVAGSTLYLMPGKDIDAFEDPTFLEGGFSLMKMTPAHLEVLNRRVAPEKIATLTHCLILGGEEVSAEAIATWQRCSPQSKVINEYGPTETVVGCSTYYIQDISQIPIPIGHPISNTQLYILDKSFKLLPVGSVGELYVGGKGVGRGYLNRSDLTAERFIPDPYGSNNGDRLYKTGDLARYRIDGTIEFLGRKDYQVKIRGFRIELGEIESFLRQHFSVQEGVVLVREDQPGEKRLIAYLVLKPDANIGDLKIFLKKHLPNYMIPHSFINLKEMPLTNHGKIDRKALPAPEKERQEDLSKIVPQTELEKTIAAIWKELLNIEEVGLHDNFFDLGGHSLKMIQFQNKLRMEMEREFSMVELFQYPTVHALANYWSVQLMQHLELPEISTRAEKRKQRRKLGGI